MAEPADGELMARAVEGLAEVAAGPPRASAAASAVVALVGPGNNGGDALYAVGAPRRGRVRPPPRCTD